MSIGDILKGARLRAGLTHDQLAERGELDQGHISRVENGKKSISIPKVEAWLAACGERLTSVPLVGASDIEELSTLPEASRQLLVRLGRLLPALSADQVDAVVGLVERWERQALSSADNAASTTRATAAKSA